MDQAQEVLDLSITLTQAPLASPPDAIASITLACDVLDKSHSGDLLTDPLTQRERSDLRWYLEEYWKWPYLEFAERGRRVEASLHDIGKRLYHAIFSSPGAEALIGQWQKNAAVLHQISILSELPSVLSLPWELLHDGQGFLALRPNHPVAIVRRLPDREQLAFSTRFELPLRILLISARPEGAGFIDPRSIARKLVDELQKHVESGTVEIEFLRPPTFAALRARLSDTKRPVHVLHFDGHGAFDEQRERQGVLLFETEAGKPAPVKASDLAKVLRTTGIQLTVLTACQSAIGAVDDAFSSVAAQLIRGGVNAVIAMSASVLVASATRYVEAFYRELAVGTPTPTAQERARLALQANPQRHVLRRHGADAGTPVELQDWWLPHFYQQRSLQLHLTTPVRKHQNQQFSMSLPRLSESMPPTPRYGFSGRAYELLQLERWLMQGKLVVIHGFGGVGKTALVREAADWLTCTKMYEGACFVSFEHGGDSAMLLNTLGNFLGIYDGRYHPDDQEEALVRLKPALREKRVLVIADNLESVLPHGEAPLDKTLRIALWKVLLELASMGAGVILTSRDTTFDEQLAIGSHVAHLSVGGLRPEDGFVFASGLLDTLGIDRAHTPYAELRDFLVQLDHHPLAISLVLPALREVPLSKIKARFTELLPKFEDDSTTGRNKSLLASLLYSVQQLSPEHQSMLSRLAIFEGVANDFAILQVTQIPEAKWNALRLALEEASLLTIETVHKKIRPYLHFHPVLVPFLRSQAYMDDVKERYIQYYLGLTEFLYNEEDRDPQAVRAAAWQEMPNLRRTLDFLLEKGEELDKAYLMVNCMTYFLDCFGLRREADELQRRLSEAFAALGTQKSGTLTRTEWWYEFNLADKDFRKQNFRLSYNRFMALLKRIEVLPKNTQIDEWSRQHCLLLQRLARCLLEDGQSAAAESRLREALVIFDGLIDQKPDDQEVVRDRNEILSYLGDALTDQGQYSRAQEAYEEVLRIAKKQGSLRDQGLILVKLGKLETNRKNYAEARARYTTSLKLFHTIDEPEMEAVILDNLGTLARRLKELTEAERCYRESLALSEQVSNMYQVIRVCNNLGILAWSTDRYIEAEGWYKRGLELSERLYPNGPLNQWLLSNLARLLLSEVQSGHAPLTCLIEARDLAKRSLAIAERFDTPLDPWKNLGLLAEISETEGRPEVARDYRRRELESFAAFPGNRSRVDQEYGHMIAAIVAAAIGVKGAQKELVAALPELTAAGYPITPAIERILAGERDWSSLAEAVGRTEADRTMALLLLRVLETLEELTEASARTPEQSIASLPIVIRESISSEELQELMVVLHTLQAGW